MNKEEVILIVKGVTISIMFILSLLVVGFVWSLIIYLGDIYG